MAIFRENPVGRFQNVCNLDFIDDGGRGDNWS